MKGAYSLAVALCMISYSLGFPGGEAGTASADSFSNRQAILSEIESQPGFGPYEIEVYNRGDLVVLDGRVASERSRMLAERIAERRAGRVVNNLVVDPAKASAYQARGYERAVELAQSVRERVLARSDLGDYDLNVRVRGETAVLAGTVADAETREIIENVALSTPGIRTVSNQLDVKRIGPVSPRVSVPDEILEQRVMSAFRQNPEIDTSGLTVTARDGVVTVQGMRPNHRDRDRILAQTLNVPGVKDIRNELR